MPVLVVGAGPVGLSLALLLDHAGIEVLVIDREPGPGEQSRAIWVHSRTLDIWDTIGMASLAAAEGRTVTGIQMRTRGVPRATLPYDGTGTTAHPHGLMLEQSRTQWLLLSLLERTRGRVEWNTALEELVQEHTGCKATIIHPDGSRSVIDAAFVVGADGASSSVRKLLGIELLGGTYDSSFFLADVIGQSALDLTRSYLNFHERSTVAVLPLPGDGHYRLIGNLVDQSGERAEAGYGRAIGPDEVKRLISANRLPLTIESIRWSATYRSHYRVASTFRDGRVLLAGDAGHLHSPAGGLGMNTGIADAANLAWKLAAVLAGAPDRLLDSYDRERRAAAQQVVDTSDRIFVLQADTRRRYAFARRNILPAVASLLTLTPAGKRLPFRVLSGTFVRYAHPGRSRRYGRLAAGRLLTLTGIPAVDNNEAVRSGAHLLLVAANASPQHREAAEVLAKRRCWTVVHLSASDARRLTGRKRGTVIAWIRPDRYIGWSGASIGELQAVLDDWMGPVENAERPSPIR